MASSVEFVGEFDFGEGDGFLHPVGAEVGRIRMNVDAIGRRRLRFATRHPITVHVLPSMAINLKWRVLGINMNHREIIRHIHLPMAIDLELRK